MPYRQAAEDLLQIKAAAGVTGLGAILSWDATTAFIGVPLNVLLASLTGALLGIAYGEPIIPRRRLILTALVNAFIGAIVTAVLPHLPLFGWLAKAPAPAVAVGVGFVMRWVLPAIIEHLPSLIRGAAARLGAKGPAKPDAGGGDP